MPQPPGWCADDHLTHLAISSPVSYLIALLLPALDVLIPILPSETAIITLGVATAGSTDPRIAILVALAAAGAFLGRQRRLPGGRKLGPFINRQAFSPARRARGARPGPSRRWTATAPASSSSAGSSPAAAPP